MEKLDLSCHICSESYTTDGLLRPHSLPCSHTMCGICVTRLLDNGKIQCPDCKQNYEYNKLDEITINRELVKVIEHQKSKKLTSESAVPLPKDKPSKVPAASEPTVHKGVCDEHCAYKVHYCETHAVYICADCAMAYHQNCKRVAAKSCLHDEKAVLFEKVNSQNASLQEAGNLIDNFQDVCKGVELHHKRTEDKLREEVKEHGNQIKRLTKQIDDCQISVSRNSALKKEARGKREEAASSEHNIQCVETFIHLDNEKQNVASYGRKTQEWTKHVKYEIKQGIEDIFTPFALATIIKSREAYATYTHNGQQRWGRVMTNDGYTTIQDFRTVAPPSWALVFNLSNVTDHLSSPRHIYLGFSSKDNSIPLGQVIIRVNEEVGMRAQQLVDLFIGHKGSRYSGSTATAGTSFFHCGLSQDVESLNVNYYLTKDDKESNEPLSSVLEAGWDVTHVKGKVVPLNTNCADFRILTRCCYTGRWDGPELGQVVSGLPVLEQIIRDNLVVGCFSSSSQVTISECGLVIDFSSQK